MFSYYQAFVGDRRLFSLLLTSSVFPHQGCLSRGQHCKQLLGVRKQTCNYAVLQEIGLLPISIHFTKIAIRNWERIVDREANPLLLASHDDATVENLPWASNVRDVFAKNGMLETYLLKINGSLEEDEIDYIEKNLMERMTD